MEDMYCCEKGVSETLVSSGVEPGGTRNSHDSPCVLRVSEAALVSKVLSPIIHHIHATQCATMTKANILLDDAKVAYSGQLIQLVQKAEEADADGYLADAHCQHLCAARRA